MRWMLGRDTEQSGEVSVLLSAIPAVTGTPLGTQNQQPELAKTQLAISRIFLLLPALP